MIVAEELVLERYSPYVPPKFQFLKWVGNKHKFAAAITKHFPNELNRYIEPFLGSGSVLATVRPKRGLGSDTFKPLIDIWKKLKDDPKELIDWYAYWKEKSLKSNPIAVYEDAKASYNRLPNGKDFLYLSRACYGGIIRFRKVDGYMSTPCGVHTPISVQAFSDRVYLWRNRIYDTDFMHCDYTKAFTEAKEGDFIYCDPPYSHSQSILYGAQSFNLNELLDQITVAKSKGVNVALSIDGNKKSGDFICELPIPDHLFEREILIKCGNSMLRRFQLEGKKMVGEEVADRLLLTY